jgi:hypothetical protein
MTKWAAAATPISKKVKIGFNETAKEIEVARWEKKKSVIDDMNGTRNVRYFENATAVVSGKWMCVSFYDLTTAVWDGHEWKHVVAPKAGKELFGESDARIDALASDGERAWVVATDGRLWEWDGAAWTKKADGGELFAEPRRFSRLVWDRAASRLVWWGGTNGKRSTSDTLFFEKDAWRKAKKSSPKLPGRKSDNYWLYDDTARGGIVRVGIDGCDKLEGEQWKSLGIARPACSNSEYRSQFVVAHDPKSKRTLWLDPLKGALFREGEDQPFADVGTAPGLVTRESIQAQGGYNWADFEPVNEGEWLWVWNPAARVVQGMHKDSAPNVCTLELGALFDA